MAYERDGIFLLKQTSAEKGVEHYGVGVGSRLVGRLDPGLWQPVVIHLMPPALRVEDWECGDSWQILQRAEDEAVASDRLSVACRRPRYELIGNNCEHFARYVITGTRESRQLQGAGLVVASLALLVLARR